MILKVVDKQASVNTDSYARRLVDCVGKGCGCLGQGLFDLETEHA